MKKKELELLLQNVPPFDAPLPSLEQYLTPANIAADIVFTAHLFQDIEEKIVVDLGCGTGIFSAAAAYTGAKKVFGIDIDERCIVLARRYAQNNKLDITYLTQNVEDVTITCDTVLMNPPFGAQKSNQKADRKFIEKGFEIAPILYSIHLTKTIPFIIKLISSLGGTINYSKDYIFPLKQIFIFHKKNVLNYEVTLLRTITGL